MGRAEIGRCTGLLKTVFEVCPGRELTTTEPHQQTSTSLSTVRLYVACKRSNIVVCNATCRQLAGLGANGDFLFAAAGVLGGTLAKHALDLIHMLCLLSLNKIL